jgi:PII-like signaling protein
MQDEPGEADQACWDLNVNMQAGERMSLEQIRPFLEASDAVEFRSRNRVEVLVRSDRPAVIMIVDTAESIRRLIPLVEEIINTGLLAISEVQMLRVEKRRTG